jgi:hypothetical protein
LPPAWFSLVWGEPPSSAIGLVVILLYTMPLLAAALPAAFSHRWWLWTPLAVGWTVPIGVAIAELRWQYLCSVGAGLAVFRTQLLLLWVAIPAGFATAFVVNLLLLRALGLRWIGASSAPAGIPASDLRGCPPLPGNRC